VTSPIEHFAGGPPALRHSRTGRLRTRARVLLDRVLGRADRRFDLGAVSVAGVLDLFEEHFYVGEITPDGHYVALTASPMVERMFGAPVPSGVEPGALWESLILAEDWQEYAEFNRRLLQGEDADASYRVTGLDGVTRTFRDRARPIRRADGSVRVQGIIADITGRAEADARAAEAADRFTSLLDVVGEHVYLAVAHGDGRVEEVFQGPGADRLLGGAVPDPEMVNWDAAIHPEDRAAYDAFNEALGAGRESDVEYRLIGADGVTRWVHDRAATRRRRDGTVEISGIVSDVTEQRRMRAELAAAHAAVSRVVEAMDDHLYTLRVLPDGGSTAVYRGPHREALVGGPLPDGADDHAVWARLLHPDDRERWEVALRRLPDGEPIELEYRVAGVDGVERSVLDRLRPRREADGTLYYDGVTRDITERRRLEDDLRRSMADMEQAHRELDAAHRAAELQARTDELTGTYNRRHFTELVMAAAEAGADYGLLLLDADHFKQVNDTHGHAVGDAVLVELARRLRAELAAGELLARWGGEEFAVLLRKVGSDDELRRRAEHLREVVRSAPMLADRTTIHLTVSIGGARHEAGPIALDPWIESADHALYAAKRRGRDRVCLATDVRAVTRRPEESESVTVARAVAFATALRADETEAHAQAVSTLASVIAERLGLPAGMVMRCRLGGWLHDVGKVAIPDAILDKPGPLSDDEWTVMRTHPVHGEAIVRRIASLRDSAAAVRHHHERYDGTGYPDRLAGPDIPIEARIIAAADTYCAMTSDRVYSAAKTPEEAAAELERSAGTHLDPHVVRALLEVVSGHTAATLREAA
jgi:diguanylate cyclase (GGDEF)-like protein/PAS domain S-box-containing protein